MKRLLLCMIVSACHPTTPVAVRPEIATMPQANEPPPIASNAVTVPRATSDAIATWDAAWRATRACLIPDALAEYDPRDALDLDLAIPRTFEEEDARKACSKLAELAAAVPAGQSRLAAVVAQLAKTRAERSYSDLDPSLARLAELVRDLDDVSGAIHRTAGVPNPIAVGTKRVPQGVYVSGPLVKTGGDTPIGVWIATNSVAGHMIAGHEVVFEGHHIDGTHYLGSTMSGNSGVEAATGTWYVWPDMRGDESNDGMREHMVVRRRDLPDVIIDDSANQQDLQVIGDGAHRAIVYHSKRDAGGGRAWSVLVSDDGGATWNRRARGAAREVRLDGRLGPPSPTAITRRSCPPSGRARPCCCDAATQMTAIKIRSDNGASGRLRGSRRRCRRRRHLGSRGSVRSRNRSSSHGRTWSPPSWRSRRSAGFPFHPR